MSRIVDKEAVRQIFGSLMKKPTLLSQKDKYLLTKDDFSSGFERYIFVAIYNLYAGGAKSINEVDIDNYFNTHEVAKINFEKNNGIEYLQDALEFCQEDNFDFYYKRLKKLNCISDLRDMGYDISKIYCEDLISKNSKEINDRFEELEIADIFSLIKKELVEVEGKYGTGIASETESISSNILSLINNLKKEPDIGSPLQGKIFNTICRGARPTKYYIRSMDSGVGKALPDSTIIPTSNGFKKVKEIKIGDYLFDAFGKPTRVLGVYPQGIKQIYKVSFKDGRTANCCEDHLWSYCTYKQEKEKRNFHTKTLKEIINEVPIKKNGGFNILIPNTYAVEYEEIEHYIPPYLFGLFLGDGSFRQGNSNKSFQYSSENSELPLMIANTMKWQLKKSSEKNYTWYFSDDEKNIWVEDVLIEHPNLLNTYSNEKFIPVEYLIDSINNRFDLLSGLLDSDGTVDEKGRIRFTTNSLLLANNVLSLCYSLGLEATLKEDNHKETSICYNIHIKGRPEDKIKLFKLKRKKEKIENWYNNSKRKERNDFNPIIKIEKTNNFEEMTCFYVDNDEHLFLTENYIVTHNTRLSVGDACGLAFPVRFNTSTWSWENTGSEEKTLFIATEQEIDEIQTLVIAYLTGINEEKILCGNYNSSEWRVIEQAIEIIELYKDNFLIVQLANPSIEQLKLVVRQNWILHDIENVFYDYIFSSPSLLNEFRDLKIREDVVLSMLSTALKDMAVEMKLFIMSATQTTSSPDQKGAKDKSVIRSAKSIADKCDIGCVISRVTQEEEEILKGPIEKCGITPNQVTDIYKVRRGKYTKVRIWSYVDLGTCRKKDLFITNDRNIPLENFEILPDFDETTTGGYELSKKLNNDIHIIETINEDGYDVNVETGEIIEEIIDIKKVEELNKKEKEKGLYDGLL